MRKGLHSLLSKSSLRCLLPSDNFTVPVFLAPSLGSCAPRTRSVQCHNSTGPRRDYFHVGRRKSDIHDGSLDSFWSIDQRRPIQHGARTKKKKGEKTTQPTVLEPFLPLELRHGEYMDNLIDFQGVRSLAKLPRVLTDAFKEQMRDPLFELAVVQERRGAAMWLIEEIMKFERRPGPGIVNEIQQQSPWKSMGRREFEDFEFDDSGGRMPRIRFEKAQLQPEPLRSLDGVIDLSDSELEGDFFTQAAFHEVIGYTWRFMGAILRRVDRLVWAENDHAKAQNLMSLFHRLLALLHHYNMIPERVYQSDDGSVATIYRKSPLLSILSSRIFATLSDSVWRASEIQIAREAEMIGAKVVYKGHELPEAPYTPPVSQLSTEIWIELLLWCCVCSGHAVTAAVIASKTMDQVFAQDSAPDWTVSTWDTMKGTIDGRHFDRYGEIRWQDLAGAYEGYNEAPPIVQVPPRSLSREILVSILDGLLAAVPGTTPESKSELKWCLKLMGNLCDVVETYASQGAEFDSEVVLFLNSLPHRLLLPQDPGSSSTAQMHLAIFDYLRPTPPRPDIETVSDPNKVIPVVDNYLTDYAVPHLAILNRSLDAFINEDDLTMVLKTLARMQNYVDGNRDMMIQASKVVIENGFGEVANYQVSQLPAALESEYNTTAEASVHGILVGSSDSVPIRNVVPASSTASNRDRRHAPFDDQPLKNFPGLTLQLSDRMLARLLDVITKAGLYDLGRFMLIGNNVDGRMIPQSAQMFSRTLQPSVLRFATATDDVELIRHLTQTIGHRQMSGEDLHALLQCHIMIDEWDRIHDILRHMRSDKTRVSLDEIMLIAKHIMQYDKAASRNAKSNSQKKAMEVLQRILDLEYMPPLNPAEMRDFSPLRQINQARRILRSCPGRLSTLSGDARSVHTQAESAISVPTSAFNTLLEGIAKTFGFKEAKQVFEQWCTTVDSLETTIHDPPIDTSFHDPHLKEFTVTVREGLSPHQEKVGIATIETIRILMQPLVKQLTAWQAEKKQAHQQLVQQITRRAEARKRRRRHDDDDLLDRVRSDLEGYDDVGDIRLDEGSVSDLLDDVPNKGDLEWGIEWYRKLGLGDETINSAVPGSLKARLATRAKREEDMDAR